MNQRGGRDRSDELGLWNQAERQQEMVAYLIERRLELELNQTDVADRIRVSPYTYASWEQGKRFPDIDTLQEVFEALEVPHWAMRKIESLVFTKAHRLRVGSWPPTLTAADFDHLESFKGPAYLHGMPMYDLYAANSEAAVLIPELVPVPFTDEQPLNVIVFLLKLLTEGDRTIGNLEIVLQRLIWLLKTLGLGIAPPERMSQIRQLCREVNAQAFEDMWRTRLAQAQVYDPLVLLRNPRTGEFDRYSMRCKHDIHPPSPYETYVMVREGVGARLARAHARPGNWPLLREPELEVDRHSDLATVTSITGDGDDVGRGW